MERRKWLATELEGTAIKVEVRWEIEEGGSADVRSIRHSTWYQVGSQRDE